VVDLSMGTHDDREAYGWIYLVDLSVGTHDAHEAYGWLVQAASARSAAARAAQGRPRAPRVDGAAALHCATTDAHEWAAGPCQKEGPGHGDIVAPMADGQTPVHGDAVAPRADGQTLAASQAVAGDSADGWLEAAADVAGVHVVSGLCGAVQARWRGSI
jgi:hypothetical protein